MRIHNAASTALLLAVVSLPMNPALTSSAHAFGLTQSAPSGQQSAPTAPRAAQGLAPSPYFDRGTRVPLAPPVLRQRSRHYAERDHRRTEHRQSRERRNDNRRTEIRRPQAGSIGLRRGDGRRAGPAIGQTRPADNRTITSTRTIRHGVDRRSPHASRDTAGISFWPKVTGTTIPRTAALTAPQFPYFGQRPGTRIDTLNRDAQRFSQRGNYWYFSAGHWYRSHRLGGFVIVLPPIGLTLPFLPVGSEEVYYENQRYYVAGGVTLREADDEYLVVNAPQIANTDPHFYVAELDQIVEPTRGQSKQRFGRDVDRCAGRAEARTGYDPDREDASRAAERRYATFSRALSRCMQTAGYSLY